MNTTGIAHHQSSTTSNFNTHPQFSAIRPIQWLTGIWGVGEIYDSSHSEMLIADGQLEITCPTLGLFVDLWKTKHVCKQHVDCTCVRTFYDTNRCFWIDAEDRVLALLCFRDRTSEEVNEFLWGSYETFVHHDQVSAKFDKTSFSIELWEDRIEHERNAHNPKFVIKLFGSKVESIEKQLKRLLVLPDSRFSKVKIISHWKNEEETFRLSGDIFNKEALKRIMNPSSDGHVRHIVFDNLAFSPEQFAVFRTEGGSFGFNGCDIVKEDDEDLCYFLPIHDDGGGQMSPKERPTPVELTLEGHASNLPCLPSQHVFHPNVRYSQLNLLHTNSFPLTEGMLSRTKVDHLVLCHCELEDNGAGLIESLRGGSCPSSITIYVCPWMHRPFHRDPTLADLIEAVASSRVHELKILYQLCKREECACHRHGNMLPESGAIVDALGITIGVSKHMKHFTLGGIVSVRAGDWAMLMDGIAKSESLVSIDICHCRQVFEAQVDEENGEHERGDDIEGYSEDIQLCIANSIGSSEHLNKLVMVKLQYPLDQTLWDTLVRAKLDRNRYLEPIKKLGTAPPRTRPALVAKAARALNSNPYWMFQLLKQNPSVLEATHRSPQGRRRVHQETTAVSDRVDGTPNNSAKRARSHCDQSILDRLARLEAMVLPPQQPHEQAPSSSANIHERLRRLEEAVHDGPL